MFRPCLCLIALAALGRQQADPPVKDTVELGGPRQVRAVITADDAAYVIAVRMLAVHTFDAATNARLNRDRAHAFALQALAKHLSAAKAVRYSVSGAAVTATGKDDKVYTLTLRVPRAGVALARADDPPPAGREAPVPFAFDSALFTRKQDYLQTIQQLAATFRADLKTARHDLADDAAAALAVRAAVAAIETRANDAFAKLRAEIKADLLLSSVLKEPEELAQTIDREQEALTRELREAVKASAPRDPKEKSP